MKSMLEGGGYRFYEMHVRQWDGLFSGMPSIWGVQAGTQPGQASLHLAEIRHPSLQRHNPLSLHYCGCGWLAA